MAQRLITNLSKRNRKREYIRQFVKLSNALVGKKKENAFTKMTLEYLLKSKVFIRKKNLEKKNMYLQWN